MLTAVTKYPSIHWAIIFSLSSVGYSQCPDNLKWHNLTLRRSSSTPRLHQYCLWDRCDEDFLLCLHGGDGVHCSHTLCLFTLADPTLLQRSFKCNTPYFFTPHQLDLTETETAWLSRFPAVTHTSVLAALLSECFRTSLSTLVHNSRKFEHASKHYVKHSKRKLSRRHEKIETHMPWGWRVKHTQSVNWTVITLPASAAVSQNTHTRTQEVHTSCSTRHLLLHFLHLFSKTETYRQSLRVSVKMRHLLLLLILLSCVSMGVAVAGCRSDRDKDHRPRENCTAAGFSDIPVGLEPTTMVMPQTTGSQVWRK